MNRISWLAACALACLPALAAEDQSGILGQGSHGRNNINVNYVTRAEPPSPHPDLGGGFHFEGDLLHRVEWDSSSHTFFGYALSVEPVPETKQCRVTIGPLTQTAAEVSQWLRVSLRERRGVMDSSYRPVMLPGYPIPQVVGAGDTIALDLMASADGKQKVVDYLQVTCTGPQTSAVGARWWRTWPNPREAPRDLNLDDIEMHLQSPSLTVNGKPVAGPPQPGEASGPVAWFAIPGKGRILVSLTPRIGYNFVNAGSIRGNAMVFQVDGDRYEVRSENRAGASIVPANHAINIYVMRDPSYEVKPGRQFGCAEKVEQVLADRR